MVTVTCVQMAPAAADYAANMKKIAACVDRVMEERPETDLIVFPEAASTGIILTPEEVRQNAYVLEEDPGIERIQKLARRYGVYIAYGLAERDPDEPDIIYNAVAVLSREGELLGSSRKVQLVQEECDRYTSGSDYPVYEADFGRFGIMVCWDTAFPETARSLALQGADLLVSCSNWEVTTSENFTMDTEADWDLLTRARAFDNTLFLAAANRVGEERGTEFIGNSRIIDPLGRVVAELPDQAEGIVSAELDLSLSRTMRSEYYRLLEDRHPETFDELTKLCR